LLLSIICKKKIKHSEWKLIATFYNFALDFNMTTCIKKLFEQQPSKNYHDEKVEAKKLMR